MNQVKINTRNYENVESWSVNNYQTKYCLFEIVTQKRMVRYKISTDERHPNLNNLIQELQNYVQSNSRVKIEEYLERVYIFVRAPYNDTTLQYTATKLT